MFQAMFNSLSGLFSFSRSLDTVSNNVANMNTPGFRGSDSFFANISGGRGARIADEGMRTVSGDIRQTGNPTDLAVDGEGYFILKDQAGNIYYTRAGQFRFNESGLLVDSVNGYEVMGLDGAGNLISIDFDDHRTLAAEATTAFRLSGNLAPGSTSTTVNSIRVFDAAGTAHLLSVTFENNSTATPGSYLVTVQDETGANVGEGEVRFGIDGTLLVNYNELTVTLTQDGVPQNLSVSFGTPGTLDGLTSLSGMSTNVSATVNDGHGVLGVSGLSFDERGVLQLSYSQNESREGAQLALAVFSNESALELIGGRLVSAGAGDDHEIGRPGEGRFGRISGGALEMSNVDLTQEFADMIIIQRGYQASSRVMTVSNEMLEQLYNSTRGG